MHQENLEAVTVCVGYADFLNETARHNKHLFDHWVVVTTPGDKQTREVCRKYNIQTLVTEDGRDAGNFHKGRMIDRGLKHTSSVGWRLHLDADIVLPSGFRQSLEIAEIEKSKVYGVDRVMVKSYEDWKKVEASGWIQNHHRHGYCVDFPKGFEVGSRWVSSAFGYVPIGFFQLWHSSEDQYNGISHRPYPKNHNNAARTDVQHGMQWDRRHRALLPEVIVLHLESHPCKTGANWLGRTTAPFQPSHDSC